MSSEIDPMSEAVGELRADVKQIRRDVDSIAGEMKNLTGTLSSILTLDRLIRDDIQPRVDDYWTWKQRAIGMAIVFSFLAGITGALIGTITALVTHPKPVTVAKEDNYHGPIATNGPSF